LNMVENRQEEWQMLESKAMQMLEKPRLLPKDAILKFYEPILRLWIYPSFSPYKVWIFYEPNFRTIALSNLIIREITWDRGKDYERLTNPLTGLKKGFDTEPRFEFKSFEIEKETFDRFFSELKQIEFSAFANYKMIGIDGVTSGIETIGFICNTRISWWSNYPKEWKNLVGWFENTTDFLQGEFSKVD
jgi:hypothetical protein